MVQIPLQFRLFLIDEMYKYETQSTFQVLEILAVSMSTRQKNSRTLTFLANISDFVR